MTSIVWPVRLSPLVHLLRGIMITTMIVGEGDETR
jgi:hypothetical protein